MVKSINFDWRFKDDFKETYLEMTPLDALKIDIPHSIKVLPSNYFNEKDFEKVTTYFKTFDLEDYDKIKNYYWYSNHDGYMCSRENKKEIIMHRLIMNESNLEIEVDHFNRNRKDNRKKNLRSLTREHNNWNKGLQTNNESGVTGVRWNKEAQKWVAYIMRKHLGTFNRFEDAVKARKRAEQKYFGEYSYNNIDKEQQKKKAKDGE